VRGLFSKYKINESKAIWNLFKYLNEYIKKARKKNKKFENILISISDNDLLISYGWSFTNSQLLMKIRYDDRNDHYYAVEEVKYGKCRLEQRIIFKKEKDFFSYLDYKLNQFQ
jgi:hypothetical protein